MSKNICATSLFVIVKNITRTFYFYFLVSGNQK